MGNGLCAPSNDYDAREILAPVDLQSHVPLPRQGATGTDSVATIAYSFVQLLLSLF